MIIKIPSRYRDCYCDFDTTTGIIKSSDGMMRVGYNEDQSIAFIDPSGGPFIEVGHMFNGRIIESIEAPEGEGFKLNFKNE